MELQTLEVADRFMRYVQIDTQSDPNSTNFPSTEKQKNLSELLVKELLSFGIEDAHLDAYGYVMATVPENIQETTLQFIAQPLPVICFCAHVDTAPDCSGTHVKPILHQNYDGQDIILPDEVSQIISSKDYPYLKSFIGEAIITASGKTLLGGDDKAGVTIIMEMAKYLMENKNIAHGPVKILFTPDEEVGRGTEHLDLKKLGADYGYTLDGGELGSFEMETFSADYLVLHIEGVIAHPGAAKGVMQNAIKVAGEIMTALPKYEWCPEYTEDRMGFIHPNHIEGGTEKARIEFLVRDFDTPKLKEHANRLLEIAQGVIYSNPDFSKVKLRMEITEQYRNMREVIDQHPLIVERAIKAYEKANIKPIITPIRGGTDGSRMSFMGLPTPNIFTGMQAIHSKHEWIGVRDMLKAVEVLVNLVEIN
jgi:tripeptide aminopeptidase